MIFEREALLNKPDKVTQKEFSKTHGSQTDPEIGCEDCVATIDTTKDCVEHFSKQSYWISLLAMLSVLLLAFGSHFAAHTLGTLKSILKENLNITNSDYGVLQSSVSIVNTVMPVFIGAYVDRFGTNKGAIASTFLVAFGNTLVALSSNLSSFKIMVIGRLIYGLGSSTIVMVQETIFSRWFSDKNNLAFSLGFLLSSGRLGSLSGYLLVIPISNYFGFYGYALWTSAIICIISFVVCFVYINLSSHVSQCSEATQSQPYRKFEFGCLTKFPAVYWFFVAVPILLAGSWTSFLHINTELVKLKFGKSNIVAANYASISQIGSFAIAPVFGRYLDKFGNRPLLLIVSSVLFTSSILCIGFTNLSPVVGLSLFSLSLSTGPIILLSSIPLFMPKNTLGTAIGIYNSSINIGNTIQDIIVGQLQDKARNSYKKPLIFLTIVGFISVLVSIFMYATDKMELGGILSKCKKETDNQLKETPQTYNYLGIFLFLSLLAVSWGLYLFKITSLYNS